MKFFNIITFAFIFIFMFVSFAQAAQLTVTAEGKGFVSSSPSGILCGYACSESYDAGRQITLTATADEGFSFLSWGGACEGSAPVCAVTLDGDKEVIARFSGEVLREYALTVYKSGNGQGRVNSDPSGITLGVIAPYDSAPFAAGAEVVLTAIPLQGSTFGGWSGACSGEREVCNVVIDAAKQATANFISEVALPSPPAQNQQSRILPPSSEGVIDSQIPPSGISLTVTKLGSGAVVSKDKNISCGSKCSFNYEKGTVVTLESVPSSGYAFGGWEGCDAKDPLCVLTLKRTKTVRALFFPSRVQLIVSKSSGGHVTSSDYKIFCGQYCVGDYAVQSRVTLTATSSIGALFKGWSGGACSGMSTTCIVDMNSSANVTATFEIPRPPEYNLTVGKNEGGEVISVDNKINCGSDCRETYVEDETVTLTAKPFTIYHDAEKTQVWYTYLFDGWGGACIGKKATCIVDMDAAKHVVANFKQPKTSYQLSVKLTGDGKGSVFLNSGEKLCPGTCTATILFGKEATLRFVPEEDFLLGGWGGPCNILSGNVSSCLMVNPSGKDVQVDPLFIVDKNPPNYRLNMLKSGNGKGEILVTYPGGEFTCSQSESNCSSKIPRDSKVLITAKPQPNSNTVWYTGPKYGDIDVTLGSKFKGWKGNCNEGNGRSSINCTVTMDAVKNINAEFIQSVFYNVKLVKQDASITIKSQLEEYRFTGYSWWQNSINCGSVCEAQFESDTVVKLIADKAVSWSGCDNVVDKTCLINLNKNRSVSVDISDLEKAQLVKQALVGYFSQGGFKKYDLSSYVQSEQNQPFKHTMGALMKKEMSNNVASITDWIGRNNAWFMSQGGIQALIDAKMKDVAKQALLSVFSSDVSAYPALKDFLINENNKPFQSALVDLKAGRGEGLPDGLKSWIQGGKAWYLSATGIQDKINELKPKPTPPPAVPSISSISPQGRQIGKATVVKGANFRNIQQVTVGRDIVAYNFVSESELVLPYVGWGMGTNPTVTVVTNGGSTWAPLISPSETVIYNGNGKLEECFGGVGKACGGLLGGTYAWGNSELGSSGCMAEVNGQKTCWVVPGSIRHDNCCVRYPGGKHCGGPGNDGKDAGEWNHNGMCVQEWHEAVWDTFWKRGWQYTFKVRDYNPDLTPAASSPYGRYNEGEAVSSVGLCGVTGHELRQIEDYKFCCSGSAYIASKKCV
ncbi:MAG: hypothetical protein Q8R15_01005 [Candidatus Micrarchaeota archaeon]|nr:hypothetical protein [Candidatus Micrarchaeota archaeon]